MAEVLQMEPGTDAATYNVPEHRYVRWGTFASVAAHLLVALIVFILAWLNHIKNLRDLMTQSIATPPPQNEIEIIFPPDETPPPPTDHPLFIKQIIKIPPPPIIPPKIKPKPVPKPPHPVNKRMPISHSESHAAPSQLVVGTGGLSQPNYPPEAEQTRTQGTVMIQVTFDGAGDVSDVEILSSSGSSILDDNTRHYVLRNWHYPPLAGTTDKTPVVYQLQ